jgi:ABC-type enterochelin transport system substrate-binding protein
MVHTHSVPAAFVEQLPTLGVSLRNLNSAAKAIADLKEELAKEKAARETTQTEVETLTRAVGNLKISVDRFATQIPIPEEKVRHLDIKVMDGLNELRVRELYLERTTKANDYYKSENAQLTGRLESKLPRSFHLWFTA